MKTLEKIVSLTLMAVLIFSVTACTTEVNTTENISAPENMIEIQEQKMETTPIILNMNGTEVHATLNNTVLAQEFKNLLPYSVTVSRAPDDLCGSVSEQLNNDDSENSQGWKIGEIGWFGGWFTILVDHEENFAQMAFPIIGKIDDEDIPFVQSLTGRVEIEVSLADAD